MSIECVLGIWDKGNKQYYCGGLSDVQREKPAHLAGSYIRKRHEQYRQMILNATNGMYL